MKNLRLILALWRFWLAVILGLFLLGLLNHYLPPQHNPAKPLYLSDPIGTATFGKLRRARRSGRTCLQIMERSDLEYARLEDQETGPGCGLKDAVSISRLGVSYSQPLAMSCGMAASISIWEKHSVLPLAEQLLDSPVIEIVSYGTYVCRNISGSRRRSEHSTADAIDIAAFRLMDGREISVLDHWGLDTPEGAFLKRVHQSACRIFNVTLGPDYNEAHADHFHLDIGSRHSCR